jgi:uncharacterized protein YhbP (UPF0306 family)
MNNQIKEFVEHQSCASLSCVDDNGRPYSFNIFYAFNVYERLLYFKSADETRHAELMKSHPFVSGTILPDKMNHLHMRGVQFEGAILPADHPQSANSEANYYHKHPFASAMPGNVWAIKINHIKFTDNSLGFGKHFTWVRYEELVA